jgi:hypothetical protein
MADQPSPQASVHIRQFFAEYVRLRQSGRPVEEAARDLQSAAERLSRNDLNELAALTQQWEQQYRSRLRQAAPVGRGKGTALLREVGAPATSVIRPLQNRQKTETDEVEATQSSAESVIRPIQMRAEHDSVICTKCGKRNRENDAHCYSCGEILLNARKGSDTQRLEDTLATRKRIGASYFGPKSMLTLLLVNTGDKIELRPSDTDLVLGRASQTTALNPDIDLTAYDGDKLGVSRLHASIKRQDRTLTITDMNSSNKTYINSQLLHPNEVRVLSDGDEIRLGRMFIQIKFTHL